MAVILALDVGEKTIGVAISDESETFAFPGRTIVRQEGYRRDMTSVRQVIDEKAVQEIVVGLPLMMDGSRGIQAEKIDEFVEQLKRYTRLPIHLQDERLSTSEAEKVLISAGRRRHERKQVIDSGAASIILQSFMDRRKRQVAKG
jgi:putative holliday junction resolvase